MFCPKCGQQLPTHARYCARCGAAIHELAPARARQGTAIAHRSLPFVIAVVLLLAAGWAAWHYVWPSWRSAASTSDLLQLPESPVPSASPTSNASAVGAQLLADVNPTAGSFGGTTLEQVFTATPAASPSPSPVPSVTATMNPPPTAKATPTPTATATPTPTATATPTPTATATPTPTATLTPASTRTPAPTASSACALQVSDALTRAYQAQLLGCPTENAHLVWAAVQWFERGAMLWRSDTKQITALFADGSYSSFPDQWNGQANAVLSPPPGLVAPVRGFGWLWSQNAQLSGGLGWGLEQEKGFCLLVQRCQRGVLLRDSVQACSSEHNSANDPGFRPVLVSIADEGSWQRW